MNGHRLPRAARATLAVLVTVLVASGLTACAEGRRAVPTVAPSAGRKTQIFAADGTLITEVLPDEDREAVSLDQVPPVLQNAVIAIEDERFWEHDGVDVRAIARALETNTESGDTSQGGSTITQQYVKIALLSREKTLQRKLEEASLALQLERNYSKEFILEQYLNTIFLGNRSYGVQVASKSYFGKPVQEVTLPEAALLAALIQAPSASDPYRNPDRALSRRNVVLRKMADLGYISDQQAEEAVATPMELQPARSEAAQPRYAAPHFVEEVKRFIRTDPRFGATAEERSELLANGGLRITTTIDLTMQAKAEETLRSSFPEQARPINDPKKSPDAALVAVDPRSGEVRAMVGGYDYFDTNAEVHSYAKYNLAVGKGRQTGSTFKVVALAAALGNGISMQDTFASPGRTTVRIPGYAPWTVSGSALGRASLTQCTIRSANTCFANLVADERVRPDKVTEYAARMGIDTRYDPETGAGFKTVPSAVLGANDNTVLDMAAAYGTFANNGVFTEPTLVTRVVDATGDILFQHLPEQRKVLEPSQAHAVTTALEGVLTSGTASGNGIGRPAAGKTGTTQDETDAWFVGYTPDLVAAIWVGYATPIYDARSPRGRLRLVGRTGGRLTAPVWAKFMRAALDGSEPLPFGGGEDGGPTATTSTTLRQNTAIFQPQRAPGTVTMADVGGTTITQATSRLRRLGLRVRRVDVEVPNALPGQVIGQSPAAGTKVVGGSEVVVETTPGDPPPTEPVPDVVGQPAAGAVPNLERGGWTVATNTAPAPEGLLMPDGQPPAPGEIWQMGPTPGTVPIDGRVVLNVQP